MNRAGPPDGRPPKLYDVIASDVLRDEHGFNAANRPAIVVCLHQVPEHLRHLAPYVETWAIPCDVTRCAFFEAQGDERVQQFFREVAPFANDVQVWLSTQPANVLEWPEAAVQFMYLSRALDQAEPIPLERQAELAAEFARREAERALREAVSRANAAYRAGDYASVVDLLEPHRSQLTASAVAKLRIAMRKSGRS